MLVRPSFRILIQQRTYASLATQKRHTEEGVEVALRREYEIKVTRLPSGLTIVSQENNSPLSRLQVVVNAGSRYETEANYGVTHRIRNCAGLGTQNLIAVDLGYHLGEVGANITATSTCDHLIFSLECLKDKFTAAAPLLAEVAVRPGFKPWELDDSVEGLKFDRADLKRSAHLRILELLRRAAFRNTSLANSLLSPKFMLGKHTPDMLNNFMQNHFVSGNMALIGYGVDHGLLLQYATESLNAAEGRTAPIPAARFGGGEIRKETKDPLTHIALACSGPSLKDVKSLSSHAVLANILGVGPRLKWCAVGNSRLARAAQKATAEPFFVSTIKSAYSDAGLFGFYVVSLPNSAGSVLKTAFGELKAIAKNGITNDELAAAKQRTKVDILLRSEDTSAVLEDMSIQALVAGVYSPPKEVVQLIEGVSNNDVQQAAQKLISQKQAMVVLGRLSSAPYLDELS